MKEKKIKEMIRKMTLEEKVKLIVGAGMPGAFGNPPAELLGVAGKTHDVERFGIPSLLLADGPAGLRIEPKVEGEKKKYYATAFPVAVMLASTWNKEILEEVGKAMGEEVREYGVDILLAPALNIQRNPLCGRNFEYYSEDPILSGEMAASFVKGIQSQGVGACVKHFAANNQEKNRMTVDAIISERALREIYLKSFEIAIKKGKPWTVMTAYNKLNGKYCSQNSWLLKEVLRNEWGFGGFVMTDWYAGDNPIEQVTAGNDMIMPGKKYQIVENMKDMISNQGGDMDDMDKIEFDEKKILLEAVKNGYLEEKDIDQCVENILRVIVETPSFKGITPSKNPDLDAHAKVAYESAAEGIILLKNEGVLPLDNKKLAIFGTGQIETIKGGLGSGDTHPRYVVSILQGAKEKGIDIDRELAMIYEEYVRKMRSKDKYKIRMEAWWNPIIPSLPQNFIDEETLEKIAERNDVAGIVISRISGEGKDRELVKGDYYLSDDEKDLIEKVSTAFHRRDKKVFVILNIGSPIEMKSWMNGVDGILLAWQAGQETGRVVADVISGKINPSGKLPITFPLDYQDVPSWNFPGEPLENPKKVVYEEDIYVGYRYYDTFGKDVAFEFGFGLSYTNFEYSNLKVTVEDDIVKVSFDVKNVGSRVGKEVTQIYIKAPKGKLDKPYQELKAFEKTKPLAPGEIQNIYVEIDVKDLMSYGPEGWILEKGEYEVRVGASSRDIRLTGSFVI